MKICLDTNAYSAIGKGNAAVTALVEEADEVIVPATVLGELVFGFLKGTRFAKNEAALNRFLAEDGISLQPATRDIAERYGYVKAALKAKGTPIPENDIWIAATALETGSRLVSFDTDFDHVGGLVRLAPQA
ncbi:MAG: type II toxin-antitoxin system VapC family toxin [Kiritimatiellae bacterium]|nr:type II toxin-antitoxin system VapC family toxin [Kiritimatiellia bacterium]